MSKDRSWQSFYDESFDQSFMGKTFTRVYRDTWDDNDALIFEAEPMSYMLTHDQSCCESVSLEDIVGELDDLTGSPITMAEEVTIDGESEYGTTTATFYKFATVKGYVTLRWFGESNGYYSESVDLMRREQP